MTGRYRRSSIEVDAKQLTTEAVAEISAWLPARLTEVQLPGPGRGVHPGVKVRTLDREQVAEWGDYMIRLGEGEFRICRRAEFESDYAEVDDADTPEPEGNSIFVGEKFTQSVAALGREASRFIEGMTAQSALAALLAGDTAGAYVLLRRLSDDTLRKVSEAGAMLSVHALVVLNAQEPAQPSDGDGE
ncbi:hypothetical protein ACPESR_25395 [Nocardia testacea]|uniref:hypothetical protein n=1 Tax=Nocardia testacea TaxID=248551 RepID=UPI003C2C2280